MCKLLAYVVGFELLGAQILISSVASQPLAPGLPRHAESKEFIEGFRKTFYEVQRIRQSKPVTKNDAKFAVIAQSDWKPAKSIPFAPMIAPIDLQLQITNLSKRDVLFTTFKSFGLRISSADGREVKSYRKCNGTTFTGPILLPEGASYSLWRRTELRWDENTKASQLHYYDGTGGESVFGPLDPGAYKLAFWYSVSPEKKAKSTIAGPAKWVGEVVTDEVVIEVLNGKSQGHAPGVGKFLEAQTEVCPLRLSKPVIVNHAKFVILAQCDWKLGKGNVPIEIQLHITNLRNHDMIFHTFDSFGLRITNADNKQLMWKGGRNLTILTRPVLVAQRASYSICRKAELRWNAKIEAAELLYWDATGSEYAFGPLRPGRHKLRFWYSVSVHAPLKGLLRPERNERDPETWLGQTFTDDVVIEVRKP